MKKDVKKKAKKESDNSKKTIKKSFINKIKELNSNPFTLIEKKDAPEGYELKWSRFAFTEKWEDLDLEHLFHDINNGWKPLWVDGNFRPDIKRKSNYILYRGLVLCMRKIKIKFILIEKLINYYKFIKRKIEPDPYKKMRKEIDKELKEQTLSE